jgi:hypothetical protein
VTDGSPARPGTARELLALMPFAVALGIEHGGRLAAQVTQTQAVSAGAPG